MSDDETARRVRRLETQCEALANLSGLLIGVLRAQATISVGMEEWLFGAVCEVSIPGKAGGFSILAAQSGLKGRCRGPFKA